jgi:hypothetical protein
LLQCSIVRYRGGMNPDTVRSQFPSLEERIREAHAEQSVAIGYAIGDALAALWRVITSLPFSPSAGSPAKRARSRSPRSIFVPHR